ncbi:MAG: polysaccharide deacetylase family protein [Solirubrobacterales bacterium]|nr:polysaccharide deacetylase family protein [Solirubrobacterales bacterium]
MSTLVLTFDNLGEASELERGAWPAVEPLGRHPSVTVALPRLLEALDRHGLRATFFVEAVNCELYPDALRELLARGHELGVHGWRHEQWSGLSPAQERGALARAATAFETLELPVRGFRPPGGELTPRTAALLVELGLSWCSPAGTTSGRRDGLAYVPFEWELVDAYHLMERFRPLRARRGADPAPLSPAQLAEHLSAALSAPPAAHGHRTLVLHPFLMLDPRWWEGVQQLLATLGELARTGRVAVLSGGELASTLAPT